MIRWLRRARLTLQIIAWAIDLRLKKGHIVRYHDARRGIDVIEFVYPKDEVPSDSPAALVPDGKNGEANLTNQRAADAV